MGIFRLIYEWHDLLNDAISENELIHLPIGKMNYKILIIKEPISLAECL
jgi:hypothetical protein